MLQSCVWFYLYCTAEQRINYVHRALTITCDCFICRQIVQQCGRKRKRKNPEKTCNTDTRCLFRSGRHEKSVQPWPWSKLEIPFAKRGGKSDSKGGSPKQWATQDSLWRSPGLSRSAALYWKAARGSQPSGPAFGLEGPETRTLLAVQPELCAWFDRVAIVKDSAKVQRSNSAPFIFTPSPLPTAPLRTEKKHAESHLVHFPKLTWNTTTVHKGGFQMSSSS